MIYLKEFYLLDEDRESNISTDNTETDDELYPRRIFTDKQVDTINFSDITIFYGGNGSGKTTLLNIIAEKLNLIRRKKYVETVFFKRYIRACDYLAFTDSIPSGSKFIASDDVFDYILEMREENRKIIGNKNTEREYHQKSSGISFSSYFQGFSLNMDDKESVNAFLKLMEAKKMSKRTFVKKHAGKLIRQYSNGENALMYFDKQLDENSLYLLDEPENSLSPQFQLELKMLLKITTVRL